MPVTTNVWLLMLVGVTNLIMQQSLFLMGSLLMNALLEYLTAHDKNFLIEHTFKVFLYTKYIAF